MSEYKHQSTPTACITYVVELKVHNAVFRRLLQKEVRVVSLLRSRILLVCCLRTASHDVNNTPTHQNGGQGSTHIASLGILALRNALHRRDSNHGRIRRRACGSRRGPFRIPHSRHIQHKPLLPFSSMCRGLHARSMMTPGA